MRTLRQGVEEYIAMKKAMGFSFCEPERKLKSFCDVMEKQRRSRITIEVAKSWALDGAERPTWWHARKLSMLRAFAVYWKSIEAKTEVWSEDLWPMRYKRKNPCVSGCHII